MEPNLVILAGIILVYSSLWSVVSIAMYKWMHVLTPKIAISFAMGGVVAVNAFVMLMLGMSVAG